MAGDDVVSPGAFPVFAGLDADDLAPLAQAATLAVVPGGKALFRQGEPGSSLYLLGAGRIDVLAGRDGGADHRLASLGPGAILGECAVLSEAPRTATALAVTDATLWEISRSEFRSAVGAGRRWAVALLLAIAEVLAERLANVDGRLLEAIAGESGAGDDGGGARVAELERLRHRLLSDWTF